MKKRNVQWRFLAIPLIFYTIWVIGPTIYTFYLSLTEWDGLTEPSFIGITNYLVLFNDSVFYTSLVNNFIAPSLDIYYSHSSSPLT